MTAEAVEWTSEFRCFVREGRVELGRLSQLGGPLEQVAREMPQSRRIL